MARRTIQLLGAPVFSDEDKAAEVIYPGHIVTYDGNGDLIKNNDDAANVSPAFALERDEFGKDIDQPYAADDQVKVGVFGTGQHVLAIIASGESVTKGDYLTTDAAGRLTKTSVSAHVRRFRALETVDNSGGDQFGDYPFGAAGDARIRVEVI